jgi:hypothetical protein
MKLMDERVTYHEEVPIEEVSRVYQSCSGCSLDEWILDVCMWIITQREEVIDCFTEKMDLELFRDIMRALARDASVKKKIVLNDDDNYLVPE